MSEWHEHRLEGCRPLPLGSYLKALGILRLLTSPGNHLAGRAADPEARGWWHQDVFHLRTRLDRAALERFFLQDYAPTPILDPWNGGGGFYREEGKSNERDPQTGKKIKTGERTAETEATRRLDEVSRLQAPRFRAAVESIALSRAIIAEMALAQAPKDEDKARMLLRLRSLAEPGFAAWLDAVGAADADKADFAPLLGSGGNDGKASFAGYFWRAMLRALTQSEEGDAWDSPAGLARALQGEATALPASSGLSQFDPFSMSAPNQGTGFGGSGLANAWDTILLVEGSILFRGSLSRTAQAARAKGSFPFTVRLSSSDSGALGPEDDDTSRPFEIWLPLWSKPSAVPELRALFSEGRARIQGRSAASGLDFARAVATLGTSRGIDLFQRVSFQKRYGNMFLAVDNGRYAVPSSPAPDLIHDLEQRGWLENTRRLATGENASASLKQSFTDLQSALFAMTREADRATGAREAFIALGRLMRQVSLTEKTREALPPPPSLSGGWIKAAGRDSAEMQIALALSSLGLCWRPDDRPQLAPGALPFAAHVVPLEPESLLQSNRHWAKKSAEAQARLTWSSGPLTRILDATLSRRLVEQGRNPALHPFDAAVTVSIGDLQRFLAGDFDDGLCRDLLAGLIWARLPRSLARPWQPKTPRAALPFAFAAIKPFFAPAGDLAAPSEAQPDSSPPILAGSAARTLPLMPDLLAALRRGDIDRAVHLALTRARGSGLASPFDPARNGSRRRDSTGTAFGAGLDPERLLAALLIPLHPAALQQAAHIAYPPAQEPDHAA